MTVARAFIGNGDLTRFGAMIALFPFLVSSLGASPINMVVQFLYLDPGQ
ncbi:MULTISPECIES: hypothetical protein [Metallosphaera]|nr:hypothetical protein [Metallosphaera sedula]MCH1770344.1 hypothetical protein [Metallosphaera sedula]MCP6727822.1 hypothetical protein [Metallosphaera sedula]